MKKILSILAVTVLCSIGSVSAQKVFTVKYESQADVKVFIVKYES